MFMHLLKFNPNHDMLGRFTSAGMGRPQEMTEMFARVAQPDGGFTWSPTSGEPKGGFALSIHPERSAVYDKLTKRDLMDYLKRNMDLLREKGNHLGAWHDPESGKVFLDVSMVTHDLKEAERLCRKHDQIAYFDLNTFQSVTINRNATSGGVVSHDSKRETKADTLHVGGRVSSHGGRGEGVHREDDGREDDGSGSEGTEGDVGQVLKFNKNHDERGRFASGGLNNADFNHIDRKIIDLKPEKRSMVSPLHVKTLASIIPGAQYVPYTKLPFFDTLMKMQGTDIHTSTGMEQKHARDALLIKQPIESVPIRDLTFTQNVVNMPSVTNFKVINAKAVQIARYKGKLYLLDGHHRAAFETMQGNVMIDGHVIDLDKLRKHDYLTIFKFNPNHDELGRFASAERSASPHVIDSEYMSKLAAKVKEREFCKNNPKTVAGMERHTAGNNERLQRAGEAIERAVPGVKLFMGPIKTGLQNKIDRKSYPDASYLTDVVRCTLTVEKLSDVPKAVEELGKHFPTLYQGFNSPGLSYVDAKALVRFPNGMVGEVQILEPHMWEAKMTGYPKLGLRPGHLVYEDDRKLGKEDRQDGKGYQDYMESLAVYGHATSMMPPEWQNLVKRGHKMLYKEEVTDGNG